MSPLNTMALLGAATASGAGASFLAQTFLARALGPSDFGLFISSLAVVNFVAPLAAFGLSQFRLKAYGAEGWGARRWLAPSLRLTYLTTLIAVSLVVAWAFIGAPNNATRFVLLALVPVVIALAATDMTMSKFRLERRFFGMSLVQVATPFCRMLVAAAILLVPLLGVNAAALGYGAIAVATTLLLMPHIRASAWNRIALKGHGAKVPLPAGPMRTPRVRDLWPEVWPFGLTATLYSSFSLSTAPLLKHLVGDEQAGMYGVAIAIITAIYLIPTTVYQKFLLADLHRWSARDRPKFWRVYRKGQKWMTLLGLAIAVALAALSPILVPLIFGESYRPAIPVLLLIAPCIPLRFLSTATSAALLSAGHVRLRALSLGVSAIVVIALDLLLIPSLQAIGAGIAILSGEVMLVLLSLFCVRRYVSRQDSHDDARPAPGEHE